MRNIISIIFLCVWFSTLAQQKPIIFHNYGIITIGDNSNWLDDIDWEVEISTNDTSFILKQVSTIKDRFIFFDVNIYKPFLLNKTVTVSVKENNKTIIEKEYLYPKNEDVGYPLIPQELTKKPNKLISLSLYFGLNSLIIDELKIDIPALPNNGIILSLLWSLDL